MDGEASRYSIRAAERVCDILDLLQEQPEGLSLQRIADATGMHKATAFRYLVTLETRRYVEHDGQAGAYRLGLGFLPLQARQLDMLAQHARPHLERLRDEFEETINLGLLDGNRVIYLEIVESPKSMRLAARRGDHDLIHCTALGKAVAAHLPRERVTQILAAEGLPKRTAKTITRRDAFLAELERVRADGYALDDGENEADGRCVAVPLLGTRLPAALSLSAPSTRFPAEHVDRVAAALHEIAQKLAGDFGHAP